MQVAPAWGRIGVTLAPGKVQPDSRHARDLATDLDVIEQWNAAAVVTLLEPHELNALQIADLGAEVVRRNMEWHHWPIADGCCPLAEFDADWPIRSRKLLGLLQAGANVLVHCKGGLGRAGTIASRLLVEAGFTPDLAIERVRQVRPGAIETHPQLKWVKRPILERTWAPADDFEVAADRALGALFGLAIGDAVGTSLEFVKRPEFAVLQDMEGGGTYELKRGEWTDDTAMSLALADSLLMDADLDARDLMARFSDWQLRGTYSCTGRCFDIGNTVEAALRRWRTQGDPFAGSTDPRSAGNGALMRLAPVAVRHWNCPGRLKEVANRQTRTTHGAAEAVDASVYLALVLGDLIRGSDLRAALEQPEVQLVPGIDAIRKGSWRRKSRSEINARGYVVHTLEAAIWAVTRTTSFRSAVLLAANLGDDADTTAAVTGQLAGALYGFSSIPADWVGHLAWGDRIACTARKLFAMSKDNAVAKGQQ